MEIPKETFGKRNEDFSFKSVIQDTVSKAEKLGYIPEVYDLGSLGMGEKFEVEDETFNTRGYYEREIKEGYKSKSLFKPRLVKHCFDKHDELVVYLDGDAQLLDCIDEIATDDYDIGVTLRDPSELKTEWYKNHFEIVKYVNAGVIFFNNTRASKSFIDSWENLTRKLGNDQKALNQLVCPDHYPEIGSVHVIGGVRIKYFPCKQYNFYHFEEKLAPNIKIMHFKGIVRNFYPFNWGKRLYCQTVVPALNGIRRVVKGKG